MKTLLNLATILFFLAPQANGQTSFGLRFGISPSQNPGASYLIVNRQDPANECLFNVEQVKPSKQVGLMVRTENENFWLMGELLFGQSETQYSLVYTNRKQGETNLYALKKSFIDVPLSIGAKLGMVEIFSGFVVSKDLKTENEMHQVDGYSESSPALRFGWHAGAGVALGPVLIDVRYQQAFSNYGTGQFINGQELRLYNLPDKLSVTAAIRF
jgi:hypothetical protein